MVKNLFKAIEKDKHLGQGGTYDVSKFINMEDITKNKISLRVGKSMAVLILKPENIELIKEGKFPFQSCFSQASGAGMLASKNTGSMLPRCHGATIDECRITYEIMEKDKVYEGLEKIAGMTGIIIYGEGKSIGRSNIVMEMMTAVSVTALSLFDILQNLDEETEIYCIKSLDRNIEKKNKKKYKSAILVCSDEVYIGNKKSNALNTIKELLVHHKADVVDSQLVPANRTIIQGKILDWVAQGIPYI
ncbi:MAG: hypothetical protein M3512_13045, partial [Bacteroidota bacterium]|nr:hypothetical protein [Bacteroidota bacterium]